MESSQIRSNFSGIPLKFNQTSLKKTQNPIDFFGTPLKIIGASVNFNGISASISQRFLKIIGKNLLHKKI